MSIASDHIPFFRGEWSDRFIDTCVVKRVTGSSFNSTTGQTTPTYTTQYSGVCLVRPPMGIDRGESAFFGEQTVEYRKYLIFIPYTADNPQVDDLVDITSTFDGILNGKQLTVRNVPTDSYNNRRVLECEDNQGG